MSGVMSNVAYYFIFKGDAGISGGRGLPGYAGDQV